MRLYRMMRNNMGLYNGVYRVESTRLQDWDYSKNAYYFITICTKNKMKLWGHVSDGEMKLSEVGEVIHAEWMRSADIRAEIDFDSYVFMPNHIHAVVMVENQLNSGKGTLPGFVAGFKAAATKKAKELLGPMSCSIWQSRYYDHIIRNDKSLKSIREYIDNNPLKWSDDDLFIL